MDFDLEKLGLIVLGTIGKDNILTKLDKLTLILAEITSIDGDLGLTVVDVAVVDLYADITDLAEADEVLATVVAIVGVALKDPLLVVLAFEGP